MRVFQKLGWDLEGSAAFRWIEINEDCYHDPDYLFLNKSLDLTFNRDLGRRCMVCGDKADAYSKLHEPYCSRHASKVCLCIRDGVSRHSCTTSYHLCEKPWMIKGPQYIPYLAIGNTTHNIKIGVTSSRRTKIRATEQGATAMLSLIHKDDYAFNLKEAQRIEELVSGTAFGFKYLSFGSGKKDYVAQNYLPHPIYDPISFFLADADVARKRLIDAFPKIKAKCLSLLKQKVGVNSEDYQLIDNLEYEEVILPTFVDLIDTELLSKINKPNIEKGDIRNGIFGNLIATKGQLILIKRGGKFSCYQMKEARGFVEGHVSQVRISAFLHGDG